MWIFYKRGLIQGNIPGRGQTQLHLASRMGNILSPHSHMYHKPIVLLFQYMLQCGNNRVCKKMDKKIMVQFWTYGEIVGGNYDVITHFNFMKLNFNDGFNPWFDTRTRIKHHFQDIHIFFKIHYNENNGEILQQ